MNAQDPSIAVDRMVKFTARWSKRGLRHSFRRAAPIRISLGPWCIVFSIRAVLGIGLREFVNPAIPWSVSFATVLRFAQG
jgi:hypothetical protein